MSNSTTERVYNFIVAWKREHDGNSPTMRDICNACNFASTSVAKYHLEKLEAQGRITIRGYGVARAIEVTGGKWSVE